jgi:outer membrane cobalamin receptor
MAPSSLPAQAGQDGGRASPLSPRERAANAARMTIAILVSMLGAFVSPPAAIHAEGVRPAAAPAHAQPDRDEAHGRAGVAGARAAPDADEEEEEDRAQPGSAIVVTARRLDTARTQVAAGLGATVYSLTNETIENRPGGETGSVARILAQAPGATLSGRGVNIRGSRADQVRINDVILPEAISDPTEQLSSRLAETTRLITGTLPAQFGFAPAGVISITTKNGLYQHGGQAELFAGSDGMLEPALEWAGSAGATSLFASASLERGRSSIADAHGIAARDRSSQIEGLAFADHVIDRDDRVSLLVGGSNERDRIGRTTIGPGTQRTRDAYAVGTFQHSDGGLTIQSSLFAGFARDRSRFIETTREQRRTLGTQIDASVAAGSTHRLRVGLLASRSTRDELDPGGNRPTAGRTAAAVYAQDEWRIGPSLTFNPGVRVEWLRGLGRRATVEPRASLVWQPAGRLSAHLGYALYAAAPPLGEQPVSATLADEHDSYFDGGVEQRLGPFTLGVDAYWRSARNYIAERETIGSSVPAPFAFRRARFNGLELSMTYAHGVMTAWTNLAIARGRAWTIVDPGKIFSAAVLAQTADRPLATAGERPVTGSGGVTWRLGRLSLSADLLVSSGAVRTRDATRPNGSHYPPYALVGFAAVYHARIADRPADVRLDLTNLSNVRYFTSDAANLEGGWSRHGPGRAITIGIEQGF